MNGNGVMRLFWVLAAAFIIGGVRLFQAQAQTETRVKHNETELEDRKPVIDSVGIIANDVQHIRDDLIEFKDEVKDTNKKRDIQHDAVMKAIRASK